MIKTATNVTMPEGDRFGFGYKDNILLLGSCFSDEMYAIMESLYFKVLSNPFGTLYNPASIATSIKRLGEGTRFTLSDAEQIGSGIEAFSSFYHNSDFAGMSREDFVEKANRSIDAASVFFRKADIIFVTFGTAWIYRHIAKDMIVSNCLKRPASEFRRELMSADDIIKIWCDEIIPSFPEKRWVFTISPIRHMKDGAHGNQISKATLMLATDTICRRFSRCSYFPAYEIMMDELRDYRYYADDLVHPSNMAVKMIWERLCEWNMDRMSIQMMKDAEKIRDGIRHRPLFPDLPQSISFRNDCRARERDFIQKISELE